MWSDDALQPFVVFIRDIAMGWVPNSVWPFLSGGRIAPVEKPNGGLRPIVVGELFEKIASNALLNLDEAMPTATMSTYFISRGQYGVNVKAGSDVLAWSLRSAIHARRTAGLPVVTVRIDIKNAFGSINRTLIQQEAAEHFKNVEGYFQSKYPLAGDGPKVRLEVDQAADGLPERRWIDLQRGVLQGDTLGSFFFALGLNRLLEHTKACLDDETRGGVTVLMNHDDITLVGVPHLVRRFMDRLKDSMSELHSGLQISAPKLQAYPASTEAEQAFKQHESPWADMTLVDATEGIVVCGVPHGSDAFIQRHWESQAQNTVQTTFNNLMQVRSLQIRMLLLRYCVVSKTNFMLRVSPPALTAAASTIYEAAIMDIVKSCMPFNVHSAPLTDTMKEQAFLPLRMCGLGLSKPSAVAHGAYIAGFLAALQQLRKHKSEQAAHLLALFDSETTGATSVKHVIDELNSKWQRAVTAGLIRESGVFTIPTEADDLAKCLDKKDEDLVQRKFSDVTQKIALATLLRDKALDEYDRARLRSLQQEGAMEAFNALPTERALTMSNNAFALRLAVVLGCKATLKLYEDRRGACTCAACMPKGGTLPRSRGDQHLFTCRARGGHIVRHDLIRNELYRMIQRAGFVAQLEPRAQYKGTGNGGPDIDVDGLGMTADRPHAFVEVSVVHPGAAHTVSRAAQFDRYAADTRERQKVKDWKDTSEEHEVIPAVLETYGAFGKGTLNLIRRCQKAYEDRLGPSESPRFPWPSMRFGGYFRKCIAVALVKGEDAVAKRILRGNQFKGPSSRHRTLPAPKAADGSSSASSTGSRKQPRPRSSQTRVQPAASSQVGQAARTTSLAPEDVPLPMDKDPIDLDDEIRLLREKVPLSEDDVSSCSGSSLPPLPEADVSSRSGSTLPPRTRLQTRQAQTASSAVNKR